MANLLSETTKLNGTAKELASTAKETFNSAKNPIEVMSHTIGERAGAAVARAQDSAAEYYNNGRDYVVENPVKGVAIAAAAGLVCGGLLAMAFRKSGKH